MKKRRRFAVAVALALAPTPALLLATDAQGADRVRVAVSGGDRPDLQRRGRLRGADGRISGALRALGHYRGQWQVDSELVESDSPCWRVRVSLEPGEPVLVGDMTVRVEGEGAADPRFTRYLA